MPSAAVSLPAFSYTALSNVYHNLPELYYNLVTAVPGQEELSKLRLLLLAQPHWSNTPITLRANHRDGDTDFAMLPLELVQSKAIFNLLLSIVILRSRWSKETIAQMPA